MTPAQSSPPARTSSSAQLPLAAVLRNVRFGKYTLLAKIGHGGMAEVFLAALNGPAGFTKLTVLKRLHPHLYDEPAFVGMFLDEARLAARLGHPNVVQTHEVGEVDDLHYLAMEYLEGQPLGRVLRRAQESGRAIPVDIAVRIFVDALDGLHYAHELRDFDGAPLGVVHRDISPGNIFLCYDGTVKLLDFGIAKAGTQLVQTHAGQVKGKFAYIAPEQAQAQGHDRRADIWSAGVVFWETFAGKRLFRGESELTTLHNVLTSTIPPLVQATVDSPETISRIAERALDRNPERRYQTALQMKEELERFMASSGKHASRNAVGAFVSELFAVERQETRRVIDSTLRGELQGALQTLGATGSRTDVSVVKPRRRGLGRGAVVMLIGLACAIGAGLALLVPTRARVEPPVQESVAATVGAEGLAGRLPRVPVPVPVPAPVPVTVPVPVVEPPPPPEPTAEERERREQLRELAKARREAMEREREHEREAPPPPPPPVEEAGYLTIDTVPWSQVILDGRPLGSTPIIRARLPAGTYMLTLVNPERGLRTSYRVTIRPGETTTRRLGLE